MEMALHIKTVEFSKRNGLGWTTPMESANKNAWIGLSKNWIAQSILFPSNILNSIKNRIEKPLDSMEFFVWLGDLLYVSHFKY